MPPEPTTPAPPPFGSAAGFGSPRPAPPPRPNWFQRITSVLFIVFCLELGLFLLIYPWTDSWTGNYFSWIGPAHLQATWHEIWSKGYVRGAVSGLGLLNIWVAVAEALRMYIGGDDQND